MALKFLNSPNNTNHNQDLDNNEIDGKCSRCGNCCNVAPLPTSKKEIQTIADYVFNNKISRFNREWIELIGTPNTDKTPINVDLRCCFYDSENKKCAIYNVRPEICKVFKCSNNDKFRNDIKDRLHQTAYYNQVDRLGSSFSFPKNITNFDLIIYGDMLPLSMYLQYFIGVDEQGFWEIFKHLGCQDTYKLIDLDNKNINSK